MNTIINQLQELKEVLQKMEARLQIAQERLDEASTKKKELEKLQINLLKARTIAQTVAQETQQLIEYHISKLVTMALDIVFPDPYEFKVKFVTRRNKSECDLVFVKRGVEMVPLESSGFGATDMTSFALRIAVWFLKKNRNVMIMDEPLKFLSHDLQEKASQVMKEISQKLGVQFIIVSHQPDIINHADRVFRVIQKDGISKVMEENNG